MPIAYEFAPDLVLVSAGFDAAVGDPLVKFCLRNFYLYLFIKLIKFREDSV